MPQQRPIQFQSGFNFAPVAGGVSISIGTPSDRDHVQATPAPFQKPQLTTAPPPIQFRTKQMPKMVLHNVVSDTSSSSGIVGVAQVSPHEVTQPTSSSELPRQA